jgi:glycosyltransferase involved in cell wall biosynthesis/GT2 family glycosyltransferase
MKPPFADPALEQSPLARLVGPFLDPDWYRTRYPDIAGSNLGPYQHFVRYGAAERRDPNGFFDSAWYVEHYPDVAASGLNPLLHYVQAGAAELRNPHPRFDAVYYVQQHPDAAPNPLLYHLRVGITRGYPTERQIDIRDFLPSQDAASPVPHGVFADVVIPIHRGFEDARRCIRSVLADRAFPLARIIVVDDRSPEPELSAWLRDLATDGAIHLIRNRRRLGFAASARLGQEAALGHDIVLLRADTEVPAGWLRRLAAQAYAQPNIATVSPLSDRDALTGWPAAAGAPGETPALLDATCQAVNAGRSADIPAPLDHCIYIRRAALLAAGVFDAERLVSGDSAFGTRAAAAGWRHRLAWDTFVDRNGSVDQKRQAVHAKPVEAVPFQFAVAAALFRASELPVILMVSHNFGGGVGRHIDSLVRRYRDQARFLLLEGTERGATLSLPSAPGVAVLTLPADRLDDLVTVLRAAALSRIHIHHLLQMDIDVRALIQRLDVAFDVTVHDYYAICPQINLLRWDEGLYCGEPGPAGCNACIADQSSHGARDIVSWRRDWAWQFMTADRVICPSADVKARLDRHGLGARAVVVPHEQQTDTAWVTRLPKFTGAPLRIVLLGVLANHKGAQAVAALAEAAEPGTIELHLIGHLEDSFPQPAVKLIKATGRYQEADLPALLQRIDPHVFWLPSSAPETYSFTLSTAIASGLPVVATDLGSFSERLAGRPLSWLVDHRATSRDWLTAFDDVRATLSRRRAKQPPVPRAVAISDFYTDRYLAPCPRSPNPAADIRNQTATAPSPGVARKQTKRRPRIAVVPERYETGGLTPCGYIRLLQPLDHPAIGGGCDVFLADADTIFHAEADLIVTQRHAIPNVAAVDRLAAHARRIGARLAFDLDDDLLAIPASHPDAATLRPHAEAVRRMLMVADAVWVSTPGLAARVASIRPDAAVIENRLDERIWMPGPTRDPLWDDPVRILCMGTTTHAHDFALIEPVLLRLKAEYGARIVIDVLGMTTRSELPAEMNRIGPSTHASRSYPGFVNWLTSMRPRWHIGLAPLLDTPFNRSKSPIKAMDYAALGLAVLASDTPVYRGSIADGPAGQLVANNPQAWHAALDWMIRDQALRAATLVRARAAFLAGATLAGQAEARRAALERALPPGGAVG